MSAFAQADNYSFGYGNGGFHINQGTSTSFTALKDTSMTFSLNSNTTSASDLKFGVFTYDANYNILSETVINNVGTLADSVSVNFNQGDKVAFWIEADGKRLYSIHSMNTNGVTFDGWQKIDSNELVFGFDTVNKTYKGFDLLDIKVNITSGAPVAATSGQPMPGVVATGVLALIAGGAFFFFRRKKSA